MADVQDAKQENAYTRTPTQVGTEPYNLEFLKVVELKKLDKNPDKVILKTEKPYRDSEFTERPTFTVNRKFSNGELNPLFETVNNLKAGDYLLDAKAYKYEILISKKDAEPIKTVEYVPVYMKKSQTQELDGVQVPVIIGNLGSKPEISNSNEGPVMKVSVFQKNSFGTDKASTEKDTPRSITVPPALHESFLKLEKGDFIKVPVLPASYLEQNVKKTSFTLAGEAFKYDKNQEQTQSEKQEAAAPAPEAKKEKKSSAKKAKETAKDNGQGMS